MKRNHLFTTMFAIALGASVAAQSQSGQTQSGQAGQSGTQGTQTQAQTQGAQGTTGSATTGSQIQQPIPGTQGTTPGSAPGSQPITLTGCLTPAAAGQGITANGGYTLNGATGGSNGVTTYALLGGDQTAMGTYGNSRVEVIGTTDPVSSAGNPTAVGTSGGTGSNPTPQSMATGAAGTTSAAGTGAAGTGAAGGAGTSAGGGTAAGAGTVGSATGARATGARATAPPPNFHVTSIRQIPGSCGGF